MSTILPVGLVLAAALLFGATVAANGGAQPRSAAAPQGTATAGPTLTPFPLSIEQEGLHIRCVDRGNGTCDMGVSSSVFYTTPVVSVATVGTTSSTPVVAGNVARVFLYCSNESATNPIYLRPGSAPTVGGGIRLNASGGVYEMSAAQGNLYVGPIYAVATQTTSSLNCLEGRN